MSRSAFIERIKPRWRDLGITRKFTLVFSLLLLFVVVLALTGSLSLLYVRGGEADIRNSVQVEQLVLEMDRGLERSRRLHAAFFLQYHALGLQQAHEQYAQASVREVSRVITLSKRLQQVLFQGQASPITGIRPADLNLYLASARRFADTSIEAVELITARAAPERGVESRLDSACSALDLLLSPYPELWLQQNQAALYLAEYLLKGRRSLLQSALNALQTIERALAGQELLSPSKGQAVARIITQFYTDADELLELDRGIHSKLRDFVLQEESVSPIAEKMVQQARGQVSQAKERIEQAYRITGMIMAALTMAAIGLLVLLARVMHNSITLQILDLTAAANAISCGRLDARVPGRNRDELGQLAAMFNDMAARIEDLVENLEKKVEQRTLELAVSERRFRYLLQDLPKIAVQGYDRQRRVIYWNRTSELLYGYSAEEAMGRQLEELIIPESMQAAVIRDIDNCFAQRSNIPSSELTLRHKDGSAVVVYSSHVVQYDGDEPVMYCVDIDLAELKLAQQERLQSQFLYRQLFDHSSSGVAVYEAVDDGADFVFRDFNRAGERIDRITREQLIGQRLSLAFPGVKESGLLEGYQGVWQSGEPFFLANAYYSDDRLQGWREVRAYRLPSGELVSVFDDITAQKEVEEEKSAVEQRLQAAQKMEAVGLLAGGVAHDLNNILSAIVSYPELLLCDLPPHSELRQPLETIKQAGERAAAVVADLLTVARGIASRKEVHSLEQLVLGYLDSAEFHYLRSANPEIRFEHRLSPGIPQISCSPVHLSKCIMNLMANGAEAIAGPGRVILSTSWQCPLHHWAIANGLEAKEYLVLRVEDSGEGIAPRDLAHIFEPFYTKKVMGKTSGTGLGLSVVWNTMRDHGGGVTVVSGTEGSCFELYLPLAETPAGPASDHGEDALPAILQGRGERILVVDDEKQQREIASSMLNRYGYQVVTAGSGEQALAYLQAHRVDLVLLDMLMAPGMNGRLTYEQMVQLVPGQRALVVSGFSASSDVKATLELGACGFLGKPYSLRQLGQAVKEALA
ncbi:hybrid sensor histidine kinase/response regulator [Desulfogranum mediterraneum]|uniref:hybrid sensor histidine kinase/response regulator n=1 Tax=Desulfogranum mediterraneum TaxID=160661 RepID=UPI0004238630|nr:response regulator [Desulfogranum mediterraneum]